MAGFTKQELRHDAVHEELEKITVTVVKKRNTILLVILILLVIGFAISQFIASGKNKKTNAENLLAQAGTNTVTLTEVTTKYPGTHGAKAALLRMAAEAAASTNYVAARENYTKVAEGYPEDEIADAAWISVARCYVGEGDYDAAAAVLNEKVMKGPHAQNAKYVLFKIYALQGKEEEALALAKELPDLEGSPLVDDITASILRKNGKLMSEEADAEAEAPKDEAEKAE
ncbi:tetratricopeptide repeat protein [bacterium]|nr:tetratricopeptide repeat protein [bacterium]